MRKNGDAVTYYVKKSEQIVGYGPRGPSCRVWHVLRYSTCTVVGRRKQGMDRRGCMCACVTLNLINAAFELLPCKIANNIRCASDH